MKNRISISEYVLFDYDNRIMKVLNGSCGEYSFDDIKECVILNERAKYHGKKEPFYVTVSTSPLPVGLFTERSFYVGLKITLKNDKIIAIYTSKTATRANTDLHLNDTKVAKLIKKEIDEIIK